MEISMRVSLVLKGIDKLSRLPKGFSMATPPLPPSAAQVLRRHVWRRVLIAALMSAVGIALLGIQRTDLTETAVLLRRGVSTQATVTENERLDGVWTLLTVEFPGGSEFPESAVILHDGVVDARRVQIVYDPVDPSTAQLEGDLRPGMLAIEFVGGAIIFILDGGDEGRFQLASIGFLLVVAALVILVRVLGYRHRLLGIAGQPPGSQQLRMWLRTDQAKNADVLLERPGTGSARWLRIELLSNQDVDGLTEPGRTVQVLGSLAKRQWLIIRAPDGRLLLPKARARQLASAEVNVQGLEQRTPNRQAIRTEGAPSLSCLLYLAAERVMVSHSDWRLGRFSWSPGISVPCRQARVYKRTLESTILAAAFVDLRDSGRITLDVITKSTGRLSSKNQSEELSVVLLDETERPGLPGALLRATQPYGDRVEDIYLRLIGASNDQWYSTKAPWYSPKAELAELGYALDDCERLVEFRDACEQAVTRWREFRKSEGSLWYVLESECRAATRPK
jgi:hypothetical protein